MLKLKTPDQIDFEDMYRLIYFRIVFSDYFCDDGLP
jgi:hypothetical protein